MTTVDAIATYNVERDSTTVFAVNSSVNEAVDLEIAIRGDRVPTGARATTLSDEDAYARNTLEEPERVAPRDNGTVSLDGTSLRIQLPPVSWTVIKVSH